MGVTKNDSTMKSEADQAQRKNQEVEIQQDKNEKNSTAGKKSNGKDTGTYKERLKEITAVLHKHAITRGVSPEKLRLILTDLGPTFIKLGQIMSMRSDILPKRYCDELMKLCSDVDPMPFAEVEEVLREAFGCPWQEEFQEIQEKPLGSASIAQVHRAVLKTGEEVVIKVQRKGIYEVMARDIGLMLDEEGCEAPSPCKHQGSGRSESCAGRAVARHPGRDEFPDGSSQHGRIFQEK